MGTTVEDIKFQKEQKRVQFKDIHRSAWKNQVENIKNYVLAFDWPKSHRIAIYYPLKTEIDLRFLHQKYPHIAYPVSEGFVFANEKTSFSKKIFIL